MHLQLSVLIVTITFVLVLGWKKCRSRPPLPPGPMSLPIVGSTFSIPRGKEWLTFTKWAQDYGEYYFHLFMTNLIILLGPIVYFTVLGKEFVVLNSAKAINDLLHTRGATYSDRPSLQMLSDMCVDIIDTDSLRLN